ncbi:MAG TPA: hypothetical protein VL985_13005 [Stellaceae bacterium]|nr:hypothetical protein [Stellaceae bacterium]
MQHLTMLINPDGRWVVEDSAEFYAALGDPHPDYDATMFAVKNLGFIRFQILDQSVIEIELHPYAVELPALLAVQQQLLMSKVRLFRIRYFDREWQSEILPSADLAVARVSELCAPKFSPPARERFFVEPQDYSRLFDGGDGPLQLLAQKWRMSFGHFDLSVISFAIKQQMLSRLMIFGIKPDVSDPVFRFIGDGFGWLETDYQFYGIGERVENQPDKDYGEWVSDFYRSVARTGQPRYDRICATIQQAPGRCKPFVSRYERLLLPWKTSSDEILVSMLSKRAEDGKDRELKSVAMENPLRRIAAKSS